MNLTHLSAEEIFQVLELVPNFCIQDLVVTDSQLLDMNLLLMDAFAIKRAGGEHMVDWEAEEILN